MKKCKCLRRKGKEKDRRRKSKQMKKLERKEKNDKRNHKVEISKGKRRTRKKTFFFLWI